MITRAALARSIAELERRLPQRPSLPAADEPHAFEWLSDPELVRVEALMEQIDDVVGRGTPEALECEAEVLLWIARGEARRAAGEPTVVERHLVRWQPR